MPGVSKITATSAENYSLLLMQFVDDTDMNSALVQVSNKLDQAKSDLPETALTPSIVQYSMNMNAFMTVAVSREGSSVYDLSDFIKNTMTPTSSARAVCPACPPAALWSSWCRCS
ncbi:MAG: efflux RND transporter permease subunit [Faecalibacterium prausnitzii]